MLKGSVYKNNLHTLEKLNQNVDMRISTVTQGTLLRVSSGLKKSKHVLYGVGSGHF